MGTNPSSKLCTMKTSKGFRKPTSRRTAIKKMSLSSRVLTSTKQAGDVSTMSGLAKEVDAGSGKEVLSNQEGLCVFDLPPTQTTQTGVSCSNHKGASTSVKKITLEQVCGCVCMSTWVGCVARVYVGVWVCTYVCVGCVGGGVYGTCTCIICIKKWYILSFLPGYAWLCKASTYMHMHVLVCMVLYKHVV